MRTSGVLMPISSLPSPYGIGTMGKSARKMDLLLPISWTKMILSMVWANPTVESIREVTAISATVQMMQFIQRASVLCMELTILLS